MNKLTELKKILWQKADPRQAEIYKRFFKTGRGEYGEGDIFLGITVPVLRKISRQFRSMTQNDVIKLLRGKIHEERFMALILLVYQYQKQPEKQKSIFEAYLDNTPCVNNWDLVDSSAPQIVGRYCFRHNNTRTLERLAKSPLLWDRRIGMLATLFFIRQGDVDPTLKLAGMLVNDQHDLMHKAVGWMLREAAKKDPALIKDFLNLHISSMPRTMLRYAIEKFPEPEKRQFLTRPRIKTSQPTLNF